MITDKLLATVPVPDMVYRYAIKRLLTQRLKQEKARYKSITLNDYAQLLTTQDIAIKTKDANYQHYEVPASFFDMVLGRYKKYSSCYFKTGNETLSEAEKNMLEITCERAQLSDGLRILELGCGWGSLSLYMAKKYPKSSITVVSNSASQKAYIEMKQQEQELKNLTVITQNVATMESDQKYDRIVSIEMFEHMRNYKALFQKVSAWLSTEGKLFIHVFGHKDYAYPFEDASSSSWMARHFFSGGQMPSLTLFDYFNDHLQVEKKWIVSGTHYAKTCKQWLINMDNNKHKIKSLFNTIYGKEQKKFWVYWRLFFMACEELFGYDHGQDCGA